jgi:hypothetical protein
VNYPRKEEGMSRREKDMYIKVIQTIWKQKGHV